MASHTAHAVSVELFNLCCDGDNPRIRSINPRPASSMVPECARPMSSFGLPLA